MNSPLRRLSSRSRVLVAVVLLTASVVAARAIAMRVRDRHAPVGVARTAPRVPAPIHTRPVRFERAVFRHLPAVATSSADADGRALAALVGARSPSAPDVVSAPRSRRASRAETGYFPAKVEAGPSVDVARPVAPRSIQVLAVPVPAAVSRRDPAAWRVLPTGRADVLSDGTGVLPPAANDSARTVPLVVRLPANAPAGRTMVATTEFAAPTATIAVKVNLVVTRVRRADVRLIRNTLAVRASDRIVVAAMVTNRGNATDTLVVDAELPVGWTASRSPRTLVLRAGQQVVVDLPVEIPRTADATHTYLSVRAQADGELLARSTADVEVLDSRVPHDRGPVLTSALATSAGGAAGSSPVAGFDLSGQYNDHTTVRGRAAFAFDRAHTDTRAIGRVGVLLGQAFLAASSNDWQATAGATGQAFSPSTGINAYGVGVSGGATLGRWTTGLLAAAPAAGASGQLLGAQLGYDLHAGTIVASATDFDERGIYQRSLHAVGVDYAAPTLFDTKLDAGLAWRQFGGGSAVGWSAGATRSTRQDYLTFSAMHTPGGTQAYSQATDQVAVSGMRRLTDRISVQAGYANSTDANAAFSRLATRSLSGGTSLLLSPMHSVSVDVTNNQFDAAGTGLGFGTGQTVARVTLHSRFQSFFTELGGSIGQTHRSVSIGATSVDQPAVGQFGLAGSASWVGSRGNFSTSVIYDHSGLGAGQFPNALALSASVTGLVVSGRKGVPTFDVSAQRYEWFGSRPGATIIRVGAGVPVGDGYRLVVDVERNPFLEVNGSSTPTVMAVKIERAFSLPFGSQGAKSTGSVYEDLNGDGVRDDNEPPLSGVMIRRGGEVTTTDSHGHFKLYQADSRQPSIDGTSLPIGLVPGATTVDGRQISLAVLPTSALEISLVPEADELGRKPHTVNYSSVVIVAKDSAGVVWTVQADSAGHARLDALPSGRYTVTADLTGLDEQLRVVGPAPVVEIHAGGTVPPVTLPIAPKTVKMFNARGSEIVPLAKEPTK